MARGAKTGGRKKGTPNRVTRELRGMIESALHDLGGERWLKQAAKDEPAAFLTLIGKCLPKDVRLGGGLKLEVNLVPNNGRPTDD